MKTVILTKGLPGSGKSTWAKQMLSEYKGEYKRVNKDDLRAMLDDGAYSKNNEKFVLQTRDNLILAALTNGYNVIVDDTNLATKHLTHIEQLVKGLAKVVVKDFTDVPIEQCIKQDLAREASVGEKVIRKMYKQFLEPVELYAEDPLLPQAIIVDIDGTLAHMNGKRGPFDWDKVGSDDADDTVINLVKLEKEAGTAVIIMSGRDSVCRSKTIDWLNKHGVSYDALLMREEGNCEKDSIIKRRLFESFVKNKFFIKYVLDDRNQVVELWRQLGLKCLQVAEGDF